MPIGPGPAAYETYNAVEMKAKKTPGIVMGSDSKVARDLTTRKIVPGPGNYNPQKKDHSGVVFGRAYRKGMAVETSNPGPGSYRVPVKFADVPRYLIPN